MSFDLSFAVKEMIADGVGIERENENRTESITG
jgi:hypothetical protein